MIQMTMASLECSVTQLAQMNLNDEKTMRFVAGADPWLHDILQKPTHQAGKLARYKIPA